MWTCPKCERSWPIGVRNFRGTGFHCLCGRVARSIDDMTYRPAVGEELATILHSIGLRAKEGCGCPELRREMNDLGPDGCRREFDRLVSTLREKYQATTWTERILAAGLAVLTGIAFKLNISDPIPDVLREAIRRAESIGRA
jgi:hypothetical protein